MTVLEHQVPRERQISLRLNETFALLLSPVSTCSVFVRHDEQGTGQSQKKAQGKYKAGHAR